MLPGKRAVAARLALPVNRGTAARSKTTARNVADRALNQLDGRDGRLAKRLGVKIQSFTVFSTLP